MIVVISEDSKSGYDFYNTIRKKYYKEYSTEFQVIRARGKDHVSLGGTSTMAGGIGRVKNELEVQFKRLTKGKRKDQKHLIYIAIDNAKDNESVMRTIQKIVLRAEILKANNPYDNVDIEYSPYYCSEEIYLGFRYLMDYINVEELVPQQRDKIIELYNVVNNNLNSDEYVDYKRDLVPSREFLRNKYKKFHKRKIEWVDFNRERLAATILEYITTANTKLLFDIKKSTVSPCWFLDCEARRQFASAVRGSEPMTQKEKSEICETCKLCRNTRIEDKLAFLLENSEYSPKIFLDKNFMNKYLEN